MISALSFVYNEADKIETSMKALEGYVDEFVIFDLESTDGTGGIAKKFTDNVYTVPYLLCGDGYKQQLLLYAKGDWVLWFYPDEIFSENAVRSFKRLTEEAVLSKINCYAFMQRIIWNGERAGNYGSMANPCYAIRLIKRTMGIFYTELIHGEVHGDINLMNLPNEELYLTHYKTTKTQEFSNFRVNIGYNYLISKYGDTKIQPYKDFIDSYKKFISNIESKNLVGERKINLSEEFWWNWKAYSHLNTVTLEEFQKITGMSYEMFLMYKNTKKWCDKNRAII